MSLSALLLSSKEKDGELDALFSSTTFPVAGPSTVKSKKRKSDAAEPPVESKKRRAVSEETVKKPKKTKKPKVVESSDEEDNGALEDAYETAKANTKVVGAEKEAVASEEDDDDDEGDPTTLVHESMKKLPTKRKGKYIPPDETSSQRDSRTVFIGNLPAEIAQKKAGLKQLKRHILALVPSAKIESVRFRSIAFQTPTSKLPDDEDTKGKQPPKKEKVRSHDRERTSAWKDDQDDSTKTDEKKFLTPSQKKRIAFINQDFHSDASSVNAYVVLAHSSLEPIVSPYDTARLVVEKCNGSTFMERVLRVDVVGQSDAIGDPKLSVFVGNLDFASKDEDLRVFFEGVVSAERGPPEEGTRWVTRVRIVRDRETQLGKGFAYVQFADHQCVDEVMVLDESKIRFAKRKLRVQRCKTTTKGSLPAPKAPAVTAPRPTPVTVRAGDPALGERIAHLSKDARKHAKSTDSDRVARRLEKKKARNSLAKDDVKVRDRVRKKTSFKAGAPKPKPSKRVRSDQSAMRKNTKK